VTERGRKRLAGIRQLAAVERWKVGLVVDDKHTAGELLGTTQRGPSPKVSVKVAEEVLGDVAAGCLYLDEPMLTVPRC